MASNRLPGPVLCILLTISLLIVGCTRGDPAATDQPSFNPLTTTNTSNPNDRSQYRYLYVVYCNGTVERLDLVLREKAGSFQLSERSGNPPAVAALPSPGPGVRTGVCLARPVVTGDMQDQAAGVVHIVASGNRDFDSRGRADFSLLTFTLPDWALQHAWYLGNFNVLNGSAPRLVRVPAEKVDPQSPQFVTSPDGTTWRMVPAHDLIYEANLIQAYDVKERPGLERSEHLTGRIFEWSADNVLFRYGLPGQGGSDFSGFGFALANHSRRHIVRLDEFPEADYPLPPDPLLAPGGQFALLLMKRLGGERIEYTGELRLYDADGRLVSTLMEPGIEGETSVQIAFDELGEPVMSNINIWYPITLTPNGLAIFTNLRGDYQFIELGQTFGVEPVANPITSDPHGTQPGVVYARQ